MAENNQHRGGFEESDVNVIAVGKAGIILLLTTILAMAMLVGLFRYFQSMDGGKAATVDPTKVFPQPQLQTHPIPDLGTVRAAEDQVLNSYGWVDQQKGIVRIPISQAMDELVQKGVPVRTSAPPATDVASQPTESGLGLIMQQPGGPLGEGK